MYIRCLLYKDAHHQLDIFISILKKMNLLKYINLNHLFLILPRDSLFFFPFLLS